MLLELVMLLVVPNLPALYFAALKRTVLRPPVGVQVLMNLIATGLQHVAPGV